jgi:predicted RNA-binding Zn-ribbon protein involved in translation (DUF1610 family)
MGENQTVESKFNMGKCLYCGADIMKAVTKCPQCGTSNPTWTVKKRRIVLLIQLGVGVVLAIILVKWLIGLFG